MQHLTVGVFHDEALGRELGKKGTFSDITMHNRKTDEYIFTFMSPVEDKLTAKSQVMSVIDAAIVAFSQMTRELGETILMLDLMGVRQGIAITTPYATADRISRLTEGTSLKSFSIENRDPVKLLEALKNVHPIRDNASPAIVVVDHSFGVKGVGEVVLGFMKSGVVRKHDEVRLLPAGKNLLIRSIQVQDEEMESAEAGTRVGLAVKGASVDEMERGSIITASNRIEAFSKRSVSFNKVPFYADDIRPGVFHATAGMQTVPVTVSDPKPGSIVIETAKPIVSEPQATALFLDLNAKKTRIMGTGKF